MSNVHIKHIWRTQFRIHIWQWTFLGKDNRIRWRDGRSIRGVCPVHLNIKGWHCRMIVFSNKQFWNWHRVHVILSCHINSTTCYRNMSFCALSHILTLLEPICWWTAKYIILKDILSILSLSDKLRSLLGVFINNFSLITLF